MASRAGGRPSTSTPAGLPSAGALQSAASTARPSAAVAEDDRDACMCVVPRIGGGAAGAEGQGNEKAAVTVVVPRPLEPPFPGGPDPSFVDAPVRAPGPVPPGRAARASSWTRPRGTGGSCSKYHAFGWMMQAFPANLHGAVARWYTSSRAPSPAFATRQLPSVRQIRARICLRRRSRPSRCRRWRPRRRACPSRPPRVSPSRHRRSRRQHR